MCWSGCGLGRFRAAAPGKPVRLVVFDFDQTLTVKHMFKVLAGWDETSLSPSASSERGQLRLIREMNEKEPYKSRGGFSHAMFGGSSRIEAIKDMLSLFKERDTEVIVCTKGLVGAVKKCLKDVQLLDLFTEVYGNTGDGYGRTPYDNRVLSSKPDAEELELIDDDEGPDWDAKGTLIQQLMERMELEPSEVVLIEDDKNEIRLASGVCRTLWVKERAGITQDHVEALCRMTAPASHKTDKRRLRGQAAALLMSNSPQGHHERGIYTRSFRPTETKS